jgi:membrane-bound serine protease (ClpP class)
VFTAPLVERARTFLLALAATMLSATGAGASSAAPDTVGGVVLVGHLNGPIGPATGIYMERLLADASARDARCLLVTLDTPGGLSDTMREIIQAILASPVPVVTFVYPEGARAASAGALIALAAHVSAMAPGTNIGAAHPVTIGPGSGGDGDDVMMEKVTNDAAAFARSIATRRGRSVEWAERVVRESISSTADEAMAAHVVDVIARDPAQLLARIDGRRVEADGRERALDVAHAHLVESPPTWRERFLARISEPNIAYLLMLAGMFGIFFELQNPGAILPGVVGGLSLLTAAFALHMLPVNWAGALLIVLAIVLFVLEIKVTSHGLLTVGGAVAMLFGSLMLIDSPSPFMRVSLSVIVPSVLFTALFFLFAVGMGVRAQRRRVTTGREGLIGLEGVARGPVGAEGGSVFVRGEFWNAVSDEAIEDGTHVEVVRVDGLLLKVRRVPRS